METTTQESKELKFEVKEYTNVFTPELSPEVALELEKENAPWMDMYREYVDPTGVYAMSPEVCNKTALLAEQYLKQIEEKLGVKPKNAWAVENNQTYMEKLLNRVNVADTFKDTIERNILHIVNYFTKKREQNPDKVLKLRSFFTGAAIAEKALLMRLAQKGIYGINLVTTDLSAHSIAFAAANLKVWNETLPEDKRYDIHIVNGEIPEELYGKARTIVLQIGDALEAVQTEGCTDCQWDALLVDNGFPYVGTEFVSQIVGRTVENRAEDGMMIAMLGLNEKVKVNISLITKLKKIITKDIIKHTDKLLELKKKTTPNGYDHIYEYSEVDKEGNILITDVKSKGGAKIYNWIKSLLKSGDLKEAGRVLNSIKQATSLSTATTEVVTNPTEHYQETVRQLEDQGVKFQEIEASIDYSGWKRIPQESLTEEERKEGYIWLERNTLRMPIVEFAEHCRKEDPVVLQTTVIEIK